MKSRACNMRMKLPINGGEEDIEEEKVEWSGVTTERALQFYPPIMHIFCQAIIGLVTK